MTVNALNAAGRYVQDGHGFEDAAAKFAVDAVELKRYMDKPLGGPAVMANGGKSLDELTPEDLTYCPHSALIAIDGKPTGTICRWCGTDPYAEDVQTAEVGDTGGLELDAFLHAIPPDYDWLIPGLLERGDRVILTGPEGGGKSTLLRQFGIQAASGIHPFDSKILLHPLRVLLLDLENSARQVHRALSPLRAAAGDRYGGGMIIRVRAEGLDLNTGDGAWLEALVAEARPDLLITGPSYKLSSGDPTEEGPAKLVAAWLDKLRVQYGCAVLLEAHSPHGGGQRGQRRPERPYGASLWLRWPEFGLHLSAEGHLRHWRGARDEREWPALLERGGAWPWTPTVRDRDILWAKIEGFCIEAGDQLARRDLVQMTGASTGSVQRAIDEHRAEWDRLEGG